MEEIKVGDTFYRYESGYEFEGNIFLYTFKVDKITPGGWWITPDDSFVDKRRWVSKTSIKKYAYPNKEDAVTSLYRKTVKHIFYTERKLHKLQRAEYRIISYMRKNNMDVYFINHRIPEGSSLLFE